MGYVKIPYYHVNKYKMGHWKPGPAARAAGFKNISCGPDGPNARQKAELWNAKWQACRRGGEHLKIGDLSWEERDDMIVYPTGSIGAGFQDYRKITAIWIDQKQGRTREEWGRVWQHLQIYASCDPNTMTLKILSEFREDIAKNHSSDLAWRCIKIWRALWNALTTVGGYIETGRVDPSLSIRNTGQSKRSETWDYIEVVHLVKRAWKHGYHGLAVAIALAWDTAFSPADVRGLELRQRGTYRGTVYFQTKRDKTGARALGTLSRKAQRLLEAYLDTMPTVPIHEPFIRNRSGSAYTKNKLAEDFRTIRNLQFPGEKRLLMDLRRSGASEALEGDATLDQLAAMLANNIDVSRDLQTTYLPNQMAKVVQADQARMRGRKRLKDGSQ